jgi:hypothetical protein
MASTILTCLPDSCLPDSCLVPPVLVYQISLCLCSWDSPPQLTPLISTFNSLIRSGCISTSPVMLVLNSSRPFSGLLYLFTILHYNSLLTCLRDKAENRVFLIHHYILNRCAINMVCVLVNTHQAFPFPRATAMEKRNQSTGAQ